MPLFRAGEFLYSKAEQEERKKFLQERVDFLRTKREAVESSYLATFNMKIDRSRDEEQRKEEALEYDRLDKIWNFDKYPEELPMCLILPGINNYAGYRAELNLNSIFQQNYSNYFVVIINDASTDRSDEIYRKYLDFHNFDKSRYVYINNKRNKGSLENIYNSVHEYCSADSVASSPDADDELIGKNVLKVFNAAFQQKKAGVIYSNFIWYRLSIKRATIGITQPYTEQEKAGNWYRHTRQHKYSQYRAFRSQLFRKIDQKSLRRDSGRFFETAADDAIYYPMMEMSCGRVFKIPGIHYLYNYYTGINDNQRQTGKQQ